MPDTRLAPDSPAAALVRELGLLDTPADAELTATLAALARATAQLGAAASAGFAVDSGASVHWVACSGATPTSAAVGEAVRVEGVCVARLCLQGPLDPDGAAARQRGVRDLADAAGALLQSRLREQRVRLTQARISDASRAGSDWLWETSPEGVLTWVSDSVEEHTGWPPTVEIGMHSLDLNRPPPGDLRASWDRYREARARREPFSDGVGVRPTAHGEIMVAISGRPAFDSAGRYIGYRGAARNFTAEQGERARAQEAQRLLQSAIEAVSAGVMISGPDGRVRLANAAWRRIFGPPAQTSTSDDQTWEAVVRGMVARGLYPEAAGREEDFVRWRLSLATDEGQAHELRVADERVLISDQRLADGSVIHLSIDITEHTRARHELAREQARASQSEARLAAVLDALPDLWFVLDADGRYLECSDEHHPWLAQAFTQTRGRLLSEIVPAALARQSADAIGRALASGQVQRFEYEFDCQDGVRRSFEARVAPMPGGQVLYLTRNMTDLRQLEREVRVMQRALEADAAVPIFVADAQRAGLPLVYANAAFERLSGQPRARVLHDGAHGLLQWAGTSATTLDRLSTALSVGRACTVLVEMADSSGQARIHELSVAPVPDASGRLVHFIGVYNDVTERSLAAHRLQLSESLYRSVAAAISDGLVMIGPDGGILAVNPAGCAMFKVGAEALVSKRLSQLGLEMLHEDGSPVSREQHPVRQVLAGAPDVIDRVFQVRRPGGKPRLTRLSVRALNDQPDGSPVSCVVIFRDITDQRATERQLAEARERWQFALDGAGDGVWDFDEDTHLAFFSPRWKEALGYTEHEVGASLNEWLDRVHPDDKTRVQDAIRRYRAGETSSYQTEHRLRHKAGHWVWVLDRGKIVERRADGSPRRVVGTHTDITRSKLAEQALRDKQAAELANRTKSEFLSRMSHEMRTPLNAVIGFAQLLQLQPARAAPDRVREYAGHVLHASEHLLALINEVLDLQRVEEGRVDMQLRDLDLGVLLSGTLQLLRPMAERHGVGLLDGLGGPLWVRADEQRLRQVLINIVSNAIKYNRRGGWVRLHAVRDPALPLLALVVEDSGAGLTPDQLARLFQPFERLGHESSAIEGSGLGLVIARGLVEEMGGRLTLSSRPGQGTRAHIELPPGQPEWPLGASAVPPAPAPEAPTMGDMPNDDDAAATRPALRVLYVEDNRINALLFEEALRLRGGVELCVAEDGAQALACVRDWTPQLLVLDAHLPDMTGFEVLARLRALPALADTPAFMCSADAMPDDLQRARDAGFVGYWTKPIDMGRLMADLDDIQRNTAP